MTSYKFVSLKDLNDPNSFHSKSVTNISSSEQIHKTISSDPKGNEYASKIEKSSSTSEINNGKSSNKREYSFESSSNPFKSEMERTNNDRTTDPVIGKSIFSDKVPSFSFLKDDWLYKTPPSHHDKSNYKSSFESMYNYFDEPSSEISHDQKKSSFARSDPLLYKGKEYSSTYEKSNYECDRKNERSSKIRDHSFVSSIPDYRFPPSHHDKYDGYLKHGGHDYQDTFDTYLRKKPENSSQKSSQIGSSSDIHSESKTEYDKLEEHSEYLYRPEPSSVKHLIKDEIDFSNLNFDENVYDKKRSTEDFSNYYFQVHRNPRVYPQASREVNNKVETSSRGETTRRKPIVHYMLQESGTRKPAVQTKKPVNLSNTAPRGSHREKYRVENFYDVDTKVVNSNLSSNSIYKERVSSSDGKKCSCIPGSKNTKKKPIVIYTYTYENDPSKLVNPPKKRVKPVNKRNIVLTSPKPSKTQSLENVSTIFSTDYLNRRFFDDYQLNKLRKSETSDLTSGPSTSASNRSCLVNKGSIDSISLSSLENIVKRQTSREGLQKHVTFSDLVSMQSYSDHEEFT